MEQSFYKDSIVLLESAIEEMTSKLNIIRKYKKVKDGREPIEYITARVKSEDSMKEKLQRKEEKLQLKNSILI